MSWLKFKKSYLVFLILACGCSQNLLTNLSSKTTDEALLEDAQKAVNAQQYQSAIDIITLKVSSGGRSKVLAKEILASGYAGRCGLNFIDFVTSLSSTVSTSAFKIVSAPFVGRAIDPTSCLQSLNTLESIAPNASRTSSQNAFAAVVGMSLMGTGVRNSTDIDGINNYGDGTQDANGISCSLTNTQVDLIILGFGFMSQNFSALSSSQIGSNSQTSLNVIISKCVAIAGGSCSITDPASITNPIRDTIRDLMNTSDYGIGTFHPANDLAIPGSCP
ncbi:MAG: hypothetical protein H7328_07090 [Bdellovibrio sp.]|nr:hypothetical protein [Bdellovibrio sp.]